MSLKLQIILIVLLIVVLIALIGQVKRKKLDLRYTLSWLVLILALIVLTCFPRLLLSMTDFLGIVWPFNMIFFCGFCFTLLIVYTLTMAISKMSEDIRCLTQKIALLEKELERREGHEPEGGVDRTQE